MRRITRLLAAGGLALLLSRAAWCAAPVGAEFRSHSHNDYAQARPLVTALAARMGSVEADVWLLEGELRLGHNQKDTRPGWTLRSDYLAPLAARVEAGAGKIYRDGPPLLLLIDLKTAGAPTYAAVARELAASAAMLTRYEGGRVIPGAVTVIITGDVPRADVAKAAVRHAACDGRPADLDTNPPVDLVPLISDNWRNHFKWDGRGEMPAAEVEKLRMMAERCHAQGRKFRLWGAPDQESAWRVQWDAGVDYINTDRPADLHAFLVGR